MNASLNEMAVVPENMTVVKRYGKRLVVDSQYTDEEMYALFDNETIMYVEHDLMAETSVFNLQGWNLNESEPFGLHIEALRSKTNGTATVAVLDSGLPLVAQVYFQSNLGYSFMTMENEVRNLNFTDKGGCAGASWHGTKVMSVLNAIAPGSTTVVLRVLDACGIGFASDITDAIVWAAGGHINGLQTNPSPAHIISMSFTGEGACPSYLQSAVSQAKTLGSVLVVAAGNSMRNANSFFPGNCNGVTTIGARTRQGELAAYSNWGSLLAFSAPGGDIANPIAVLTLDDNGGLIEGVAMGTSFAVPHVSGLYSLLIGMGISVQAASAYFPEQPPERLETSDQIPNSEIGANYTRIFTEMDNATVHSAGYPCDSSTIDGQEPFDPGYGGSYQYSYSCGPGTKLCNMDIWGYDTDQPPKIWIYQIGLQCCNMQDRFVDINSYQSLWGTGIMTPREQDRRYVTSPRSYGTYSGWTFNVHGFAVTNPTYQFSIMQYDKLVQFTVDAWIRQWGVHDESYQTCPGESLIVGFHGYMFAGNGIYQANVLCRRMCACTGNTYEKNGSCVTCPACGSGKYLSGCAGRSAGSCSACPALTSGYYFKTAGACDTDMCPADTYSSGSACVQCASNSFSLSSSTVCTVCQGGSYFKTSTSYCTQCDVGKYSTAVGGVTGACVSCDAGKFSPTRGSSYCTDCSAGTYAGQGSTDCVACESGKYSTAVRAANVNTCIPCNPGSYTSSYGATACRLCEPGTATNTYSTPGACGGCTPTKTFAPSAGLTACIPCSTPTCGVGYGPSLCTIIADSVCVACTSIARCTYLTAGQCVRSGTVPACVCDPGYEMVSGFCMLCNTGKFKADADYSTCVPWTVTVCPQQGTYLVSGSPYNNSACVECPELPPNSVRAYGQCSWGCEPGFDNNQPV